MIVARRGKRAWNYKKHLSPIHRAKLATSHIGKRHTKKTRDKMSIARKGENNPFYGKHHSLKSKDKISIAKKEWWTNKKR